MLINIQTGQVFHAKPGKEYSEHFLRQFKEVKAPLDHKGITGFSIGDRARMKQ